MDKLISVVIPVYNRERYLGEAIESVLKQNYNPLEIIIIDDGSSDNSADVARGYGDSIRYYFHENRGLGFSRNRGIELARGEYIAFLDSDDIWSENKLHRQMAVFDNNPEIDLVFGMARQFISPELDEETKSKIYCPPEPMSGYSPSALLVKSSVFERVGLFNIDLKLGDFIDWYARTTEAGFKSFLLPEIVFSRRLHKTNTGVVDRDYRGDYTRILKAALDRRRRNSS